MSIANINATEAKAMIDKGAVLVDIRGAAEHARERIAGARSVPADQLQPLCLPPGQPVIFHCNSGGRTASNAAKLEQASGPAPGYVLTGGINAWKAAGLPVIVDKSQPIEIMRQVQITAGSLVLLGVLLGYFVNPAFYGLSAFIGAGLVFSGVSGSCAMASMLSQMPWNRRAADGATCATRSA